MNDFIISEEGLSGLGLTLAKRAQSITEAWLAEMRKTLATARDLPHPILIDTLPRFLRHLAEALTPGFPRSLATESNTLAHEHGGERARLTQYHPQHLLVEYHALKEIIFSTLGQEEVRLTDEQRRIINASIDIAVRDAITAFVLVQTTIREQFMATLTHDLRNPLSSIAMASSLILKNPSGSNVPGLAAKIQENSKRIDRMIQDLLDATMVRMGGHIKLELTEFDLFDLLQETADEIGVSVGDRFELVGESTRGYWGRESLKRAIENLLTNAEKYGDPTKKITLTLKSHQKRVSLSVHNEGPPIPPEDQEAIFEAFLRTQSARTGKKKGWGLGLSLVRAVAESHGGSILVDSEISRGTTFVVDLPQDCREFVGKPITG